MVFRQPATLPAAWAQVREWLQFEPAWVPMPTEQHAEVMERFCALPWLTSRLVPDAHLAALAVEHGLTLCSTDGDFARFPGLTWHNPLQAAQRPRRADI